MHWLYINQPASVNITHICTTIKFQCILHPLSRHVSESETIPIPANIWSEDPASPVLQMGYICYINRFNIHVWPIANMSGSVSAGNSGITSIRDEYSGDSGDSIAAPPHDANLRFPALHIQCPTCLIWKRIHSTDQQQRILQHRMCGTCRMSMSSNWWLQSAYYMVQCCVCTQPVHVPLHSYNENTLYTCNACPPSWLRDIIVCHVFDTHSSRARQLWHHV